MERNTRIEKKLVLHSESQKAVARCDRFFCEKLSLTGEPPDKIVVPLVLGWEDVLPYVSKA